MKGEFTLAQNSLALCGIGRLPTHGQLQTYILHWASKGGKVKRTEDMVLTQEGLDEQEILGKAAGTGTDTHILASVAGGTRAGVRSSERWSDWR